MNARTLQDLDRRLRTLEKSAVKLRKGEVTADGLVLGGAACDTSTPIPDPPVVGPPPEVGDTVTVLTGGNQAVALPKLGSLIIPSVSTLPASAPNGTVIAFQGNWVCRYSNAAPDNRFPWAVLFGPTRQAYAGTSRSVTATAFITPSGPVTVSMPPGSRGIVDVTISASAKVGAAGWIDVSYSTPAGGATEEWAASFNANLGGGTDFSATVERTFRHTVTVAGGTFQERLRSGLGTSVSASYREIRLCPIWVGP